MCVPLLEMDPRSRLKDRLQCLNAVQSDRLVVVLSRKHEFQYDFLQGHGESIDTKQSKRAVVKMLRSLKKLGKLAV